MRSPRAVDLLRTTVQEAWARALPGKDEFNEMNELDSDADGTLDSRYSLAYDSVGNGLSLDFDYDERLSFGPKFHGADHRSTSTRSSSVIPVRLPNGMMWLVTTCARMSERAASIWVGVSSTRFLGGAENPV